MQLRQIPAFVARALFHLLPVLPLAQGRGFGTIAAVLFVALPYIKVKKLEADLACLESQEASAPEVPGGRRGKEIAGLKTAVRRWRAVTFLPGSRQDS
jgi:hypothetical protein